jgi:TRAP-type C4-dicarboxylate transport system permease small subunit
MDIDALPQVMGADGQFHATDDEIDLSDTTPEAWAALLLFWALGLTVFHQFFTRYALNNSASWTEEIARYLLVATVFIGAAIGVAKNNHIQVDLLYRWLPHAVARALATLVDVLRLAFCVAMAFYTWQMMGKLGGMQMTVVDLPMNLLYGTVLAGFLAMAVRSAMLLRLHLKRGYSVLEKPEGSDERSQETPQPAAAAN